MEVPSRLLRDLRPRAISRNGFAHQQVSDSYEIMCWDIANSPSWSRRELGGSRTWPYESVPRRDRDDPSEQARAPAMDRCLHARRLCVMQRYLTLKLPAVVGSRPRYSCKGDERCSC